LGGKGREIFSRKTSRMDHSSFVCLIVAFLAGLGWQSKGDSVAVRFTQDDFLLVNNIDVINETSDVEAFVLNDVFADNFGKDDVLDDAGLDGLGVGQVDGDVEGSVDEGNFVSLGLVFLAAVLVFSGTVVVSVSGRLAAGDLHGFGLVLISHLGNLSGESLSFGSIAVGAKLVLVGGLSNGTDSSDLIVAVIVIFDNLDGQCDGGDFGGESGHTDLSVDRGVGIPAVVLGTVPVGGGVVGKSHKRQQSQDESLHD